MIINSEDNLQPIILTTQPESGIQYQSDAYTLRSLFESLGLTPFFVEEFEAYKAHLHAMIGIELSEAARQLGVDSNNKDVINAFANSVFPNHAGRTVEQQTEVLGNFEREVMEHFRVHNVTAASTGSYTNGGARNGNSDYDALIVVEPGYADEMAQAMNSLHERGFIGFNGNGNGSLRGPDLVMGNGFQGFGFTRVMKVDEYGMSHTIELFCVGENSLPLITQPGAIIEKLQPASFSTMTAQSLVTPGLENLAPVVLGANNRRQIITWPTINVDGVARVHKSYFVNLFFGLDIAVGHDPRGVLRQTRESVFDTFVHQMIEQAGIELGCSPEYAMRVMGYDSRPISDKRRAELMSDYQQAIGRWASKNTGNL